MTWITIRGQFVLVCVDIEIRSELDSNKGDDVYREGKKLFSFGSVIRMKLEVRIEIEQEKKKKKEAKIS